LEVARGANRRFRPLKVYPEFHAAEDSPCASPGCGTPAPVSAAPVRAARLSDLQRWQVLLSTGFGVGLLAAAALCRLLMVL
jgi:hypothetical protein